MVSASNLLLKMVADSTRAVVTEFDLFVFARKLFRDRGHAGIALPDRNGAFTARRARQLIYQSTFGVSRFGAGITGNRLSRDRDFRSVVFVAADGNAAQVMLEADPICLLSHASALAFHGLVEESRALHVSSPMRAAWNQSAHTYMEMTLGESLDKLDVKNAGCLLPLPKPNETIRQCPVLRHERSSMPDMSKLASERVTDLGTTFRDTLLSPQWCGGMQTIVDIWRKHAGQHREAIIAAIDTSPEKIVRVRAGYLLEEVLAIQDPRIANWVVDAQRGSSRKLDPSSTFAPRFSARWMLSINIEDDTLPANNL